MDDQMDEAMLHEAMGIRTGGKDGAFIEHQDLPIFRGKGAKGPHGAWAFRGRGGPQTERIAMPTPQEIKKIVND